METLEKIGQEKRPEIPKVTFPYKVINEGVPDPEVVWTSTIFDYGGYALMSRNYIRGLTERGWKVGVEAIRGTLEISEEEKEYFNSKRKIVEDHAGRQKGVPYLNPNQISIVAHLPLWNIPKFKRNIIYSMMESKDTNRPFIERCNSYYDACWTPTEYNKNDFLRNGMRIPVTVMPIGVDQIYFDDFYVIENMAFNFKPFIKRRVAEAEEISDQPQGFKFLSVFRWSFRKGFDVLLKSYLKKFTRDDNVSLVIFSRHAAMSHDPKFIKAIENDILKILQEHAKENHAPIYWCSDYIEQDLMPSMYNLCDAFVSTSRGEGFCIPALEASQMGLPAILPSHTGFTDYVSDSNCYQIPVDEWVVCNDIPEWSGWITRDFYGQKFPKFGADTIDIVSEHMSNIYLNHDKALEKNKNMKKLIEERYTWDKCIERAEKELRSIQ